MKFDSKNITELIEKKSIFFQELLNEYKFYISIGNSPDGKWFNKFLLKRKKHIDQIQVVFNNVDYKNIFENEISENIRQNFKKLINEILSIDSKMKEILTEIKNKKSEQLVKIKKINKLLTQKADTNKTASVINVAVE